MKRPGYTLALVVVMLAVVGASIKAQNQSTYPVADEVAAKVIAKYQNSSCAQLQAQKQHPPSGQQAAIEQKAIQQLKEDPQMREYFLNKVAGPIANKLFECGMIP
jgi:hypothetical protein